MCIIYCCFTQYTVRRLMRMDEERMLTTFCRPLGRVRGCLYNNFRAKWPLIDEEN